LSFRASKEVASKIDGAVAYLSATIAEAGSFISEPYNDADLTKESEIMLWTIIVILVILWLLGFIGHFGGPFIHILVVVAVIILIFNLISGRRSV
jgi:fatty acid desaturase